MERQRVLFVCTHNSARSQMAEALLRSGAGDRFDAFSAGTATSVVRPEAVAVMAEIGVDISGQRSKTIEGYREERFTWLITVCDQAREACPVLPGVPNVEHWSIDDPSSVIGNERVRLDAFRRARDEIRTRVEAFIAETSRGA